MHRAAFRVTIGLLAILAVALAGCDANSKLTDAEFLARAQDLRAKGNDKAAIVEVRNALQKNPKNIEARVVLAEIYADAGAGKQAQNEVEIALQRGANASRVKLPLARAYLLQRNYDGAAKEATVTLSTRGVDRARLMEVEARARIGMRQFEKGCALFESSSAADPGLLDAYWGSATCAAVRGDGDAARAILDKAIAAKPGEAKSWVLVGDVDRTEHRLDDAEKAYTKALTLKKNDIDALIGRALVHAEAKKLDLAEADVKQVNAVYPGHPMAVYVTGLIRFRQSRFPEAKNAFETTLTTAPQHFPSILWLGLTNFVQGNYEVAATQLNQYVTLLPGATKVRALVALSRARIGGVKQATIDLGVLGKQNIDDPETLAMIGETHTFLGNVDAGSQFLARAVELSPETVDSRAKLATALLNKDDVAGALVQLREALRQQPDSVQVNGLMVRALIQSKDLSGAMAQAQAFERLDPKNPAAADYIGSIQLLQGDTAAAQATFTKLLEANPGFFAAANNLALMAIKRGDLDAARGYYERAIQQDPRSVPAILGLHSVERAAGRAAEADKALLLAVKTSPTEVLPAQMLAQVYLSGGQPRKALDATSLAFAAHPADAGLLEMRGLAYLAANEPASAIVAFNKLVQTRSDSAAAYLYLADTNTALGDKVAAKAALATALRLDPKDVRIRVTSGMAMLGEGRPDAAMALARTLQQEKPNDPGGYVLEAAAFTEQRKPRDAVRVLDAAVRRFPKLAVLRLSLARARVAAGDPQGMLAGLVEWRKAEPTNPVALEALAEAYLKNGDESAAVEVYRAQLASSPNNVRALNNTAFLLRTKSSGEAAELAERAARLDPGNASAFDTLGEIRVGREEYKEAIAALRKANELDAKNPRFRYHLADALAKAGQEPLARRELERLLAASRGFDDEAQARELLARLPRI